MRGKTVYDGFTKVYITEDGKEVVAVSDAVAIFVYHRARGILLIEQERSAMRSFFKDNGRVLEVVAGRFDRTTTLHELVIAELNEEAGITVDESQIIFPQDMPMAISPGIMTERMHLAYVEVNDSNITGSDDDTFGLAEEGERIKRRWLSVEEALSMQWHDLKSWALFQWFLNNRYISHRRRALRNY